MTNGRRSRLGEGWRQGVHPKASELLITWKRAVGRNADDLFVALFVHNCDLANVVRSCGQVYLFMDSRVLRKRSTTGVVWAIRQRMS